MVSPIFHNPPPPNRMKGMPGLLPEIWRLIFEFDPTYLDFFRSTVLVELHRRETEFMADLFFYLFWESEAVSDVQYEKHSFRFETDTRRRFTVEWLYVTDVPKGVAHYRIFNEETGMWYDEVLENP